jgi:protein-S-isoprenylcysteine O-methyltransferase Ste14
MRAIMKKNYTYYRILYSAFAFSSLSIVISYHLTLQTILLWRVQSIEIILASTGLAVSSAIMLIFIKKFFFELSGADALCTTKKSGALIKSSLYKHVRHPLYTATLMLVWSIFFLHPSFSNLLSSSCITAYTIIGIRYEENKLIKNFGKSYIQYRLTTPMLIPRFTKVFK